MSYNENKELCTDLNKAAQPGTFARYTGDEKESRMIRKEAEATAGAKTDRDFIKAIVELHMG